MKREPTIHGNKAMCNKRNFSNNIAKTHIDFLISIAFYNNIHNIHPLVKRKTIGMHQKSRDFFISN